MSGLDDSSMAQEKVDCDAYIESMSMSQSSTDANSSCGNSAERATAPASDKSGLLDQIQSLRQQQQAINDQKKQLAKDMKNAVRKKKHVARPCPPALRR